MLGVLIIPLALAIWSRSGVVVANRSGYHSRLTTGAPLGLSPLTKVFLVNAVNLGLHRRVAALHQVG